MSVRKKNLRLQSSFSVGFTENKNAKQQILITSEVIGGHANTRRDYFEPYLKFYLQKIYLIKMITIYRHTPLTKTCLPTIFVAFKRIITIVRQTGNTQTNCTMSTMNDIFSTPDKPDLSLSTECDVCNICQWYRIGLGRIPDNECSSTFFFFILNLFIIISFVVYLHIL